MKQRAGTEFMFQAEDQTGKKSIGENKTMTLENLRTFILVPQNKPHEEEENWVSA